MNPPDDTLLASEDLAVRIGPRWLCRHIGLGLRRGEMLAVLGPNGAGKTTLLHTLAGLREPAAGTLRLCGLPYPERSARDNALLRGLLPQNQPDPFSASVLETALVGRHPHLGRWSWESREDRRIALAALAEVGMEAMAGRDLSSLSGGERQRVAIAALLAQQPRLFLLDEPLNHLDLHYQIAVLDLFRGRCRGGCAVVMVLHDINLAARYADQAILLDGQGEVAAGPSDSVLQPEPLSRAYGHPLTCVEAGPRRLFVPE